MPPAPGPVTLIAPLPLALALFPEKLLPVTVSVPVVLNLIAPPTPVAVVLFVNVLPDIFKSPELVDVNEIAPPLEANVPVVLLLSNMQSVIVVVLPAPPPRMPPPEPVVLPSLTVTPWRLNMNPAACGT